MASVSLDSTLDTPTVAVDSEVLRLVKALRPEDTWALVGEAASATMVESAVEKITPSDVVAEIPVDSEVVRDSAEELTSPAEVVVDNAAEAIADSEV